MFMTASLKSLTWWKMHLGKKTHPELEVMKGDPHLLCSLSALAVCIQKEQENSLKYQWFLRTDGYLYSRLGSFP